MKLKSRIPTAKLLLTVLLLQAIGVGFVYFRETLLLDVTQCFVWVALAALAYLLIKQKGERWGNTSVSLPKMFWARAFKIAGLFLLLLFFFWQINYLSLYESQPLMFTEDSMPVRYDVVPGDLLGYTLRMVLQTWVLALALALVLNKIPRGGEFGFLRGTYKKLSTLAWYLGNFIGGAVSILVLVSLGLLTLDTGKFLAKAAGADVMNVPQLDLVVFLFSLYVFNLATGFTKKLKTWGEHPNTSLMFVISAQLAFVLFVYCMTHVMMQFLPGDTVYALMEPFYFDFIDYTAFPKYWQLFVAALSIFTVPVLASYFYHASQGQALLSSTLSMLIIPLGIGLALTQIFPTTQTVFYELLPNLNVFAVTLDNASSRYEITWVSYCSVGLLLGLVLVLQRSQTLMQSLVDVMPEQVGRRLRRVKAYFSRAYSFFIALLMMYLLGGVVVSLYFSSIFLMATLLGLALCFVAGLKPQEA